MTIPSMSEEIVSKYWQFMRDSDSSLSAQEVFKMLGSAEQYLALISQQETSGEVSEADAVRIRVNLRNSAKSILNRAGGLGSQARQALKDFILQQPEFLPGEYRFTVDSMSGNIKTWEKHLSRFTHQPDLEFLEIGSFEGGSACWLLKNVLTSEDSRLTCIDTFDSPDRDRTTFKTKGLSLCRSRTVSTSTSSRPVVHTR